MFLIEIVEESGPSSFSWACSLCDRQIGVPIEPNLFHVEGLALRHMMVEHKAKFKNLRVGLLRIDEEHICG
jgi:hypothetical protein